MPAPASHNFNTNAASEHDLNQADQLLHGDEELMRAAGAPKSGMSRKMSVRNAALLNYQES